MKSSSESASSTRAEATVRIDLCFAVALSSRSSPLALRPTPCMEAAKAPTSKPGGAPPGGPGGAPAASAGGAPRAWASSVAASKSESSRSVASSQPCGLASAQGAPGPPGIVPAARRRSAMATRWTHVRLVDVAEPRAAIPSEEAGRPRDEATLEVSFCSSTPPSCATQAAWSAAAAAAPAGVKSASVGPCVPATAAGGGPTCGGGAPGAANGGGAPGGGAGGGT
eukprot:scaffold83732_cov69-Phaeocystis_antarctica.AAC.1